jgi:hypothetical protein
LTGRGSGHRHGNDLSRNLGTIGQHDGAVV